MSSLERIKVAFHSGCACLYLAMSFGFDKEQICGAIAFAYALMAYIEWPRHKK